MCYGRWESNQRYFWGGNTDSGLGIFKEDISHVNYFMEEMNSIDLKINLYLPNITSVSAELDQFFVRSKEAVGVGYYITDKLDTKIKLIKQNVDDKHTRMNSNIIEEMNNTNESLKSIRNDPDLGDHHDASNDQLIK